MKHQCQNIDTFHPDAGKVDEAECGVCGSLMNVTRNCEGWTGFISGMCHLMSPSGRGEKRKYDLFVCPHHDEQWHCQVKALRKEAKGTASTRLQKMFEEEIQEILTTHVPEK